MKAIGSIVYKRAQRVARDAELTIELMRSVESWEYVEMTYLIRSRYGEKIMYSAIHKPDLGENALRSAIARAKTMDGFLAGCALSCDPEDLREVLGPEFKRWLRVGEDD